MYDCLIAPSEKYYNINSIKRALLTYNKIFFTDPNDRDFYPPTLHTNTVMGMNVGFLINMGAVRPLGKIRNYDSEFEKLIEHLRPAITQGIVSIISTYDRKIDNTCGIGSNTGNFPLNTIFMFSAYRSLANDQNYLKAAVKNIQAEINPSKYSWKDLSYDGLADWQINDLPKTPELDLDFLSDENRKFLSNIAKSRIASTLKIAGFCEQKQIIPVLGDYGSDILSILFSNSQKFVDAVDDDGFWKPQARVATIAYEEYYDDEMLSLLSIEDILSLRTSLWGRNAEARDKFFEKAQEIALENKGKENFSDSIRQEIKGLKTSYADLEKEREKLKFKFACDVGTALAAFSGVSNLNIAPVSSFSALVTTGAIWGFKKAKEYYPKLVELEEMEKNIKRNATYDIHHYLTN